MSQNLEDFIPVVKYAGLNTEKNVTINANLTVTGTTTIAAQTLTDLTTTGNTILGNAVSDTTSITGATTITSTSASALVVGPNGATNPALKVVASTASMINGIQVTGSAANGVVAVAAVGGDTHVNVSLAGKGSGAVLIRSFAMEYQGAQTAKTVSATLTAAELATQIITVNQGGGATSALQLPVATDLDALIPVSAANDAFEFSVINISTTDAEDASVTTNTGWTLVGNMDIHAYSAAGSLNSSARFLARKTGTGAWTLYRIA